MSAKIFEHLIQAFGALTSQGETDPAPRPIGGAVKARIPKVQAFGAAANFKPSCCIARREGARSSPAVGSGVLPQVRTKPR